MINEKIKEQTVGHCSLVLILIVLILDTDKL
jgi:hypothetical protein